MESGGKRFLSLYARPLILIVGGFLLISASVGITTLNVPSQVIPSQAAVTTSACGEVLSLSGGPSPGTGILRYNCSASSGAFTITTVGSDTPSFNPPPQISAVGYILHSASSCSGSTSLTSGSSIILGSKGDFDICAVYSCPTGCGLNGWSFNWSN